MLYFQGSAVVYKDVVNPFRPANNILALNTGTPWVPGIGKPVLGTNTYLVSDPGRGLSIGIGLSAGAMALASGVGVFGAGCACFSSCIERWGR